MNLYEQEDYDLFHDDGKAPVGQGKLMIGLGVRVRVRVRVTHQSLQLSTALRGGEGIMVSPPYCAVGRHGRHGDASRHAEVATSPRNLHGTLVIYYH